MRAIDRAETLALILGCQVATRMENPGLYKYEGLAFHYRTMELAISAFRAALIALELRRENND